MSGFSLRRALAAVVACASLALLAACGSSSTESALTPTRLISFGDAFSDLGQNGGKYTVNDTATNHWLQQLAVRYGRTFAASNAGGTGYGQASARITDTPDAAGNAATPTVTQQIDNFLAADTIGPDDVIILSGGVGDIIAETAAFTAGTQTRDQMLDRLRLVGEAMAAQTRRLVAAGAEHVVVVGPYNLGVTPWGQADSARTALLRDATQRVNDGFLVSVVDMGAKVLYVDAAYYFNLLATEPSSFSLDNSVVPVCTSTDAGAGIGIGAGQLNSSLCTDGTIAAGVNYNRYMFADAVYPTPVAHRLFGDYAYDRIRNRW
jgi:outer membrane lipase/esterase